MSFGGSVAGAIVSIRNNMALKNHRRTRFYKRKNKDILKDNTFGSNSFEFKSYTDEEKKEMRRQIRSSRIQERFMTIGKGIAAFVAICIAVYFIIQMIAIPS